MTLSQHSVLLISKMCSQYKVSCAIALFAVFVLYLICESKGIAGIQPLDNKQDRNRM